MSSGCDSENNNGMEESSRKEVKRRRIERQRNEKEDDTDNICTHCDDSIKGGETFLEVTPPATPAPIPPPPGLVEAVSAPAALTAALTAAGGGGARAEVGRKLSLEEVVMAGSAAASTPRTKNDKKSVSRVSDLGTFQKKCPTPFPPDHNDISSNSAQSSTSFDDRTISYHSQHHHLQPHHRIKLMHRHATSSHSLSSMGRPVWASVPNRIPLEDKPHVVSLLEGNKKKAQSTSTSRRMKLVGGDGMERRKKKKKKKKKRKRKKKKKHDADINEVARAVAAAADAADSADRNGEGKQQQQQQQQQQHQEEDIEGQNEEEIVFSEEEGESRRSGGVRSSSDPSSRISVHSSSRASVRSSRISVHSGSRASVRGSRRSVHSGRTNGHSSRASVQSSSRASVQSSSRGSVHSKRTNGQSSRTSSQRRNNQHHGEESSSRTLTQTPTEDHHGHMDPYWEKEGLMWADQEDIEEEEDDDDEEEDENENSDYWEKVGDDWQGDNVDSPQAERDEENPSSYYWEEQDFGQDFTQDFGPDSDDENTFWEKGVKGWVILSTKEGLHLPDDIGGGAGAGAGAAERRDSDQTPISSDAFADEDIRADQGLSKFVDDPSDLSLYDNNSSKDWLLHSIDRAVRRPSHPSSSSRTRTRSFRRQRDAENNSPHNTSCSEDGGARSQNRRRRRRRGGRISRATSPGAVQMDGRAYGGIPNWALRAAAAGRTGSSHHSSSNAVPSTQPATATGNSSDEDQAESICIHATAVAADPLEPALVYAKVESMPSSIKIICQDRRSVVGVFFAVLGIICISLFVGITHIKPLHQSSADHINTPTPSPTISGTASLPPTKDISRLKDILTAYSTPQSLETIGSPQQKAMFWLANHDRTGIEPDDKMFVQRYAAVVLFFATSEDPKDGGWMLTENWLDPNIHECLWGRSITCIDFAGSSYFYSIDLSKNGLKGRIPPEIGLFENLEYLYLDNNKLYGPLPDTIGNLISTSVLILAKNALTGSIPTQINGAKSLSWLDLSKNKLNGTIPTEVYDMTSLRTLDLKFNDLSGTIEEKLSTLTALTTLNLVANKLSGTLPNKIFSMYGLAFLGLDYNSITGRLILEQNSPLRIEEVTVSHNLLSGVIPSLGPAIFGPKEFVEGTNIGDLFRMARIDLSNNLFTGQFPLSIGLVPSIKYVDASHNDFNGSFPYSFGAQFGFDNVEFLNFAHNSFTGTIPLVGHTGRTKYIDLSSNMLEGGIPTALAELKNLDYLRLSGNSLGGEIPRDLSRIKSLRNLYLRNCDLTGIIPSSLGRLSKLNSLDLGDNSLSGTIPERIGNMALLNDLHLDENMLSGTIPEAIGKLRQLQVLNLEKNLLTGSIPEQISNVKSLEQLRLVGNKLDGSVPTSTCDLGDLTTITVDCDISCDCCEDYDNSCI